MTNSYLISLLAMATILISCGANPTKLMSKTTSSLSIGMPESEFKEKVQKEQLALASPEIAVYELTIKTYNKFHAIISGNGWRQDRRFFYFVDGKLNLIDKGEKAAADYDIKVN